VSRMSNLECRISNVGFRDLCWKWVDKAALVL